ncbi:MAG: four helix bundle protein [Planctomycetota bacterium]|nr:four helix bundle protein [Planctomycetota bacterium]
MTIESYRDLRVWQASMSLAESCYSATRSFPKEEVFGMTSQMRRGCVSIPANIAEGWGRDNTGDYIHFLRIAQGSLEELETHAILAQRISLLTPDDASNLLQHCEDIGKMLRALIRSLQEGRKGHA